MLRNAEMRELRYNSRTSKFSGRTEICQMQKDQKSTSRKFPEEKTGHTDPRKGGFVPPFAAPLHPKRHNVGRKNKTIVLNEEAISREIT